MKIAITDREILNIFWAIWGISTKISGKMWPMIILKVTKNQGFTLPLEDKFFGKPQWGGGRGGMAKLTPPPSGFRLKKQPQLYVWALQEPCKTRFFASSLTKMIISDLDPCSKIVQRLLTIWNRETKSSRNFTKLSLLKNGRVFIHQISSKILTEEKATTSNICYKQIYLS